MSLLQLRSGFLQGFFMKLKDHLAPRLRLLLQANKSEQILDDLDPDTIYFKNDTMYRHNIMRTNYTTYDVRRAQDTINPNTDHRDILLLAQEYCEEDHPLTYHQYRYARVLGIYHVNVIHQGNATRSYRLEFLWVRWFEVIKSTRDVQDGWSRGELDHLRFCKIEEDHAFGFVDPAEVMRASHVIPRFSLGRHHINIAPLSIFAKDNEDWKEYFANRSDIRCFPQMTFSPCA